MTSTEQKGIVRWGLVGAAGIAGRSFLPGLQAAGRGRAVVVGSRDAERGAAFAKEYGVERSVVGYEEVVTSPDVDAVYVALANVEHAEWTARALEAGKPVLCEKPLVSDAEQAERVVAAAKSTAPGLLWEACQFVYRSQHRRVLDLIADGAIGAPREVISAFQVEIDRPGDFRMAPVGGGSLADVGCYSLRLGEEILGRATGDPLYAAGRMEGGIDVDVAGIVGLDRGRLYLTCGFRRGFDVFARILGQEGQIHLTSPFHPGPDATLTLLRPRQEAVVEHAAGDDPAYQGVAEHIHGVLLDGNPPEHLVVDTAVSTARTLDALRAAVIAHPLPE
ncbi:MAG TPA: Gfo/Idh/MocA family oxidoreductase [Acidimicrobiales bacterium]|nr:Gfo/Idh/MocA family oxidoreductase [Acidimicrobiales bacterium]